jgi:hypothetical protein
MEQALASGAPRAVVGWASHADAHALRRLQVAAVTGGALAFLYRPVGAAAAASAAPLRLRLTGTGEGKLSVQILKRRGPPATSPVSLALSRPARLRQHEQTLAGHPATRHTVCA